VSLLSLLGNKQVDKKVTPTTNIHTTTEEPFDASFSVWSVPYRKKAGDFFSTQLSAAHPKYIKKVKEICKLLFQIKQEHTDRD
jgi:hypothetical protein